MKENYKKIDRTALITMKEYLKSEAKEIREMKAEIKVFMRARKWGHAGSLQWKLSIKQETYRLNHIAYSMARGKTYKEIENKVKVGNEPNFNTINSIYEKILPFEIQENKYA